MNKSELISKVVAKTGHSKTMISGVVGAVFSVITEALTNNVEVKIPGFGNFSVSERASLEGRNPRTGEPIIIAAQKVPRFKTGKSLKSAVNGW